MKILIENEGVTGVANYNPLRAWAIDQARKYAGLVINEENIKLAKKDIAELRSYAKQASDLRIALKKDHEKKIAETIEQLKDLTTLFSETADSLAGQVKEIEDAEADKKIAEIRAYWDSEVPAEVKDIIPFRENTKWRNKTFDIKDAIHEIDFLVMKVDRDMQTMKSMGDHYSEMVLEYSQSQDLSAALARRQALLAIEKPVEKKQENNDSPVRPLDLRLYVTEHQKDALREFLKSQKIRCEILVKGVR